MRISGIPCILLMAFIFWGLCQAVFPAVTAMPDAIGTTVTPLGPAYNISGGTWQGTNLFHSFNEFSLNAGTVANFLNPGLGENIIGRISGGGASTINGLIQTNSAANLFLINPAGFVFGSTSGVNVNGSIHISTADFLELGLSTGRYYANPVAPLVLSSDAPSAFGFLNPNPASISITGNPLAPIASPTGMVSLVGGDITIQNTSAQGTVAGARVNIVSVDSAGVVVPGVDDIDVSSFTSMGNISLDSSAMIVTAEMGQVFIRGGNFTLDNSSKVVSATTSPAGGGTLDIALTGDLLVDNGASIVSTTSSAGNGASISVSGVNLTLDHGGQISTLTTGTGDAGSIVSDFSGTTLIQNPKNVPLTEQDFSGFFSITQTSSGAAGDIQIDSAILNMLNGGTISDLSLGAGNGGNVTVTGATSISLGGIYNNLPGSIIFGPGLIDKPTNILVGSVFSGQSGQLSLTAPLLSMNLQSEIQGLTANLGSGNSMQIDAVVFNMDTLSKITSYASGIGTGNGLTINGSDLNFDNGSQIISANTSSGGGGDIVINSLVKNLDNSSMVVSSTTGTGPGADITIGGSSLGLEHGSQILSITDTSNGQGGKIDLDLNGNVYIRNPNALPTDELSFSGIYSISKNAGLGGDIEVDGTIAFMNTGGTIGSFALSSGDAGNISLTLSNMLWVTGKYAGLMGSLFSPGPFPIDKPSVVSTVNAGTGSGGSITVQAPEVRVESYGQIQSLALNSGSSKDISLDSVLTRVNTSGRINSYTAGFNPRGSDISISGEKLYVNQGGHVISSTAGGSSGGDITVNITDLLHINWYNNLAGAPQSELDFSGILSIGQSSGRSGDIDLRARNVEIFNGASIYSLATGNGETGDMDINVAERVKVWGWYEDFPGSLPASIFGLGYKYSMILNGAAGSGDAGEINIQAQDLELSNKGAIWSTSLGTGLGANLNVDCSDSIEITGGDIHDAGQHALDRMSQILAGTKGAGHGGKVILNSRDLRIGDGGHLILAIPNTSGMNSALEITATDTFDLYNRSRIINHSGNPVPGMQLGHIDITAGIITIRDIGLLESYTWGTDATAKGPHINLDCTELRCLDGGVISTANQNASIGGDMTIRADKILLDRFAPEYPFNKDAPYLPSGLYSYVVGSGAGGDINIEVREMEILDGATIAASTVSSGRGSDVNINASESLLISGGAYVQPINPPPGSAAYYLDYGNINVATESSGDAADLMIRSPLFTVSNGAYIAVTTGMVGKKFLVYGGEPWTGNGGSIFIEVDRLEILNGGRIGSSVGAWSDVGAHGGEIVVTASEEVLITGRVDDEFGGSRSIITGSVERAFGRPDPGNVLQERQWLYAEGSAIPEDGGPAISITTPRLTLSDSGAIAVKNEGYGDAGTMVLDCDILDMKSGGSIFSYTLYHGGGGSVTIDAGQVSLSGGANINSSSETTGQLGSLSIHGDRFIRINGHDSGIFSTAHDLLNDVDTNTGKLSINTPTFEMQDNAEINSSTSGTRSAGSIQVDAYTVQLSSNSLIASDSTGEGEAGSILIKAAERIDLDDSQITTMAEITEKGGGNITLLTRYMLEMVNSRISAEAKSGYGSGGNILIDPIYVILHDSQILANAYGGSGGTITIIAQFFLSSVNSLISASSQLSTDGVIEITAPSVDISGSIEVLPSTLGDTTGLLPQKCSSRKIQDSSTFMITTRSGVNPSPNELLFSP